MRWPRPGAYARPQAAVQAAVFPGVRQTSTCCECWRSGSHERWVKNCNPTGVAVEQTSNIARGAPGYPAESRQHNTMLQDREVLQHAGPMGPGVPRALQVEGTGKMGLRRTRRRKEYGRFSMPASLRRGQHP